LRVDYTLKLLLPATVIREGVLLYNS
jgi:hypothetical protein